MSTGFFPSMATLGTPTPSTPGKRTGVGGKSFSSLGDSMKKGQSVSGLAQVQRATSAFSGSRDPRKKMFPIEDTINLDHLMELKKAFHAADEDKQGTLDAEEFINAFGKVLGKNKSNDELMMLFMKIDANSDNNIDWDEFCTYMLLENQNTTRMETEGPRLREFTSQDFADPNSATVYHRDMIDRIVWMQRDKNNPKAERYVTTSRDGTFRLWNAGTLRHKITVQNSTAWISDCVHMPQLSRLAVAAVNRTITFYDSGTLEFLYQIKELENAPVTMDYFQQQDTGLHVLIIGDDGGHVLVGKSENGQWDKKSFRKVMPKKRTGKAAAASTALGTAAAAAAAPGDMGTDGSPGRKSTRSGATPAPRPPATALPTASGKKAKGRPRSQRRRLHMSMAAMAAQLAVPVSSTNTFDSNLFDRNRPLHDKWLTKVKYISEYSMIASSSLDGTIKISDLDRRTELRMLKSSSSHGILSFAWCSSYKYIISCGLDRQIRLWNPYITAPMASLSGHAAPVTDVVVSESEHQFMSLSTDKTIKVWDIRTHRCVQTITDKVMRTPEDKITSILYDPHHEWLVTGTSKLTVWPRRKFKSDTVKSHDHSLTKALYNREFGQVVSGDDGANISVWDFESGRKMFQFVGAEDRSKISALTFDSAGRRLITGSHDGNLWVWNFNNGQRLRELVCDDRAEITEIVYVHEGLNKYIVAVGWNRKVCIWLDMEPSGPVKSRSDCWRQFWGHTDDISTVAFCPPNLLATGSYDGTIMVWNIESGYCRFTLTPPNKPAGGELLVEKILILPNKQSILAACGSDGLIQFWNVKDGSHLGQHDGRPARDESIMAMATDDANNRLFTADAKGFLRIWDISALTIQTAADPASFQYLYGWRSHMQSVVSIDWVSKYDLLLTASTDCTIRLWTQQGNEIGVFGQKDVWKLGDLGSLPPADMLPLELESEPTPAQIASQAAKEEQEANELAKGEEEKKTASLMSQLRNTDSGNLNLVFGKSRNHDRLYSRNQLHIHRLDDIPEPPPRTHRATKVTTTGSALYSLDLVTMSASHGMERRQPKPPPPRDGAPVPRLNLASTGPAESIAGSAQTERLARPRTQLPASQIPNFENFKAPRYTHRLMQKLNLATPRTPPARSRADPASASKASQQQAQQQSIQAILGSVSAGATGARSRGSISTGTQRLEMMARLERAAGRER